MVVKFIDTDGLYVYGDAIGINADGEHVELNFAPYRADTRMRDSHPVTVLISREQAAHLLFNEQLKKYEDWDFFIRCAVNGFHGIHLGEPVLYIRDTAEREKSAATAEEADAAHEFINRSYAQYFDGDKQMAGCCGGKGTAVIKAKQTAGLLDGVTFQVHGGSPMSGSEIRMEYTGHNTGARTFKGKDSRRVYKGGNNPIDRYADVHPDDVEKLISTGLWLVVRSAEVTPAPAPVSVPQVLPQAEQMPQAVDWDALTKEAGEDVGQVQDLTESPAYPADDQNEGEKAPEGMEPAISMEGTAESGSEITGWSAKEAIKKIKATTDRGQLLAWRAVEADGKKRKSVLAAITAALGF